MARPEVRYGDSLELFQSIPFELVYHDRAIAAHEDKGQIIFHRHAEILVPDRLGLEHLVGVACRSDAERRMLLHGMSAAARTSWEASIREVGDALFFRAWPHLDTVYGVDEVLHLRFNALPWWGSSIPVALRARELGGARVWTWSAEHSGSSELKVRLPGTVQVEVEVEIHGCVAFRALVALRDEQRF